ncbi:hypothetical protein [Nocardiopsis sp. CNT312]|uniref:hypothetical protein n=1 Tax=Nocardiopsis sp. CNT312 TaxID=1137268 RepID=UPI0012DD4864|nr:hypothetical protein [Nocardiopsis sp. CNT312]
MDVLLVDDAILIDDVAEGLTRRGHQVHTASDPHQARQALNRHTFDVALVDILYTQEVDSLEENRRKKKLSITHGPFIASCLMVLKSISDLQPNVRTALWSESDDKRLLHMRYAQEHFGVKNFYRKNTSGSSRLDQAIRETAAGKKYIDPGLEEEGIGAPWIPLGMTLLANPRHLPLWRALACGARSNHAIKKAVTQAGLSYKRDDLGEMAREASSTRPFDDLDGNPLAYCSVYAQIHQAFLFDATIAEQIK